MWEILLVERILDPFFRPCNSKIGVMFMLAVSNAKCDPLIGLTYRRMLLILNGGEIVKR
jgi:hypothetical protein